MKFKLIFLALTIIILSCNQTKQCDLIIKHANILDVKTGSILKNKALIITNGIISSIVENHNHYNGNQTIDAAGKLVTPSFIDTHIHPTDVFGDRENAPDSLDKNARQNLSDAYLPYGTTTTLMLGQPEYWLDSIIYWQKNPSALFTDHFTSGGAMISVEDREPYIGHCVLEDSIKAKSKIIEYHKLGINHIKLYYRLNNPEFELAYKTADSLKMKVYGHIGGFSLEHLKIYETIRLGLTNYEHLGILPCNVLTSQNDWNQLNQQFLQHFGQLNSEAKVLVYILEQFRYLDENKKDELNEFIDLLAKNKVSFSTTIHLLYQVFDSTYFTSPTDTTLSLEQSKRCNENFDILMEYAKKMHDKGVELRLGSDMVNGGKVNISELIMLSNHGFSIADVLKIASFNGAKAIGIENETGSLEVGKKANLIIWEQSPFENSKNFTSDKTVVKDGVIYTK